MNREAIELFYLDYIFLRILTKMHIAVLKIIINTGHFESKK